MRQIWPATTRCLSTRHSGRFDLSSIRLGVIGLSQGNGHPYSWSAIFNGYDSVAMEDCGFPSIPRYLEKQQFPHDTIAEARVTNVWTQDSNISAHIAKATYIETVSNCFTDMIGQVDGVLLARDDAETHSEFAAPFLKAGIPIYIDKPLALTLVEANQLLDMQRYQGQLFSCSALRYAKEFQLSEVERSQIGRIRHIHATVPKDWDKYAVHAIEPLLLLGGEQGAIIQTQKWKYDDSSVLSVKFSGGLHALICVLGSSNAPIALRVIGESGWKDLFFQDSYYAFKAALFEFVQSIILPGVRIEKDFMLKVVKLIELGRL